MTRSFRGLRRRVVGGTPLACGALLALMLAAASLPAAAEGKAGVPSGGDSERVIARSNGFTFAIPQGYLSNVAKRHGFSNGIDLHALWPGLVPEAPDNAAAFKVPGGGARVTVAIRFFEFPERRRGFLSRRLKTDTGSSALTGPLPSDMDARIDAGPRYGLQTALIDLEKVRAYYQTRGFKREAELDEFIRLRWDDLFYRQDGEGLVTTLITCTTEQLADPPDERITGKTMVPIPHCSHDFVVDEINARIGLFYRRRMLAEWYAIERSIKDMILAFLQK